MLKLRKFCHNLHPSGVKMLAIVNRRGIWVISSFILMITFVILGNSPATSNSDAENERAMDHHLGGVPNEERMANSALPAPVPAGSVNTSVLSPWNKVVFESIRDGNWEIYSSNADGSNPTRLTFDPAIDIHPRLAPGALQIVFSSNRSGHYELYMMNSDGSNLTRLTFTTTDNVNPAWSRDGAHIAFESYRDGQAEVYKMDANGANQVRLTKYPGFNGEPSWSPDGTRIAFASYRNNQNRIWVMNADGTHQTQLNDTPYSENPAWSPDGYYVAFDADANGTGFQSLYEIESDGTWTALLHQPGAQTDDLVRSWSSDSPYIAFTTITWVKVGTAWQWTSANLNLCIDTEWSTCTPQSLGGVGLDKDPDIAKNDIWPPSSHVLQLPRFSPASGFKVSWNGQDAGPSGLAYYKVSFLASGYSAWYTWEYGTPLTSEIFNHGTPGDMVYFRSQATDNAGNTEPEHSGPGDASTQLYSYTIGGKVQDNR